MAEATGAMLTGGAEAAGVRAVDAPPQVVLEVPRLLSDCTEGRTELAFSAGTIESAFGEIRRRWPTLATHVFEETGAVRPHVLVLHNGKATRWMPSLDVPLRAGDRLQIVQAVSGG